MNKAAKPTSSVVFLVNMVNFLKQECQLKLCGNKSRYKWKTKVASENFELKLGACIPKKVAYGCGNRGLIFFYHNYNQSI